MTTTPHPQEPVVYPGSPTPLRALPAIVYGFATVVAMWCVWLLTHIPGLNISPAITGGSLLATLLLGTLIAGWSIARGGAAHIGWQVGASAGLLCSLINLLVLGSYIAEQAKPGSKPAEGFTGLSPSALLYIPGFLLAGAVIGAIGGAIGAAIGRSPPPPDGRYAGSRHWLARLSIVTLLAVLPLILLGGMVTSTASGMAVPGWPDSYGANMFLFPISLMSHPRIFLEHSHRLFGAMVGLTVLTLMVCTIRTEARRWVRGWVIAMFIAVCLQGLLGGLRVRENSPILAMTHGILAQLFFAMCAAGAMYLQPAYTAIPPVSYSTDDHQLNVARKRRIITTALLHTLFIQLAMGAWFRHYGKLHPLYAHIAISLAVVILAVIAGMLLRTADDLPEKPRAISRRFGKEIIGCVMLQFLLGWGTFAYVLKDKASTPPVIPTSDQLQHAPPIPLAQTLLATAHHANGAVLLGLAAASAVLARAASPRRRP
ncbi:MAG: COX15/CtaA family protein [Phycisphaerales bacterium]|nr:COX15/CtaA family protein [Phycisphaerales bacterium]